MLEQTMIEDLMFEDLMMEDIESTSHQGPQEAGRVTPDHAAGDKRARTASSPLSPLTSSVGSSPPRAPPRKKVMVSNDDIDEQGNEAGGSNQAMEMRVVTRNAVPGSAPTPAGPSTRNRSARPGTAPARSRR